MIARLIEWSMRNRFAVACLTICVVAFGIRAVLTTPVDAIPDLSETVAHRPLDEPRDHGFALLFSCACPSMSMFPLVTTRSPSFKPSSTSQSSSPLRPSFTLRCS